MFPKCRPTGLALGAALAAVALTGCGRGGDEAEPRPVMVAQPQPAAGEWQVFAGSVVARRQPELAFRVGGRILKRSAEVGDRVRAGQVLAELDPEDLQLEVDAAAALIDSARAELELARSERDRFASLLAGELISRSDFDARQTRFEAAEARLKEARAQHAVARNRAGYARLTAPADGVIAERRAEVGQVVAAGQAVFVLAVDGEREVAISLPERDVNRYRVGQAVQIELWARPGQRFAGRIREIAPEADARARTYAARVAFVDAGGVELGQSARVRAHNDAADTALAVPLPAVARFDETSFVWVLGPDGGTLQRRPVTVAAYREDYAVIASGLDPADWVVVAGASLLEEGLRVRPVDRDNRPLQ